MIAEPQIPEQLESIADLRPALEEIGEEAGVTEGVALSHVCLEGIQMQATDLMLTELTGSRVRGCAFLSYDFSKSWFVDVAFEQCDFSNSTFEETSFFRMNLDGVDLSDSKLGALTISDGMDELRGCCMDLVQAAGIAKRLGVIIKEE